MIAAARRVRSRWRWRSSPLAATRSRRRSRASRASPATSTSSRRAARCARSRTPAMRAPSARRARRRSTGIPAGASIVAAYLYWGGSGAAVDANVTLNGQAVAAQRTFTATFNNGGTNFPYFGGFADVTARITGNGTLTFSGLTVTTGTPHCGSSAVRRGLERHRDIRLAERALARRQRVRRLAVLPRQRVDVESRRLPDSADELRRPHDDRRVGRRPRQLDAARRLQRGAALQRHDRRRRHRRRGQRPDDSAVRRHRQHGGVATSYGVDVDTFDVTALLAPGQTSATTQFSAGGDLVLLTAQVVSATSEPVVDLR